MRNKSGGTKNKQGQYCLPQWLVLSATVFKAMPGQLGPHGCLKIPPNFSEFQFLFWERPPECAGSHTGALPSQPSLGSNSGGEPSVGGGEWLHTQGAGNVTSPKYTPLSGLGNGLTCAAHTEMEAVCWRLGTGYRGCWDLSTSTPSAGRSTHCYQVSDSLEV